MKTNDLKGAITCPKCCTAPVCKDNMVYCPNCGFKVECKPHQCCHKSIWNKAVREYEHQVLKERTTYKLKVKKEKKKKTDENEFTPESEKRKRYPEACHYSDDYFDGDGYYYPACSEEASRIRLGFENAAASHYHRTTLYDSVDNPFFSEENER